MVSNEYSESRWGFIDKIQDWFNQKNYFWLIVSILTFSSILILQVIFNFAAQTNPKVREEVDFLVAPVLALFAFRIFWRGLVQTFLCLAGGLTTYAGMFLFYTRDFANQIATPFVANRLGYGIKSSVVVSPDQFAEKYFIVGIFALSFCLAMAIKPNFFKPKDSGDLLPYPIWRYKKNFDMVEGLKGIRLIPLSSLLTFAEQHLDARFKYITVIMGGRKYLVSPYDWVPEGTVVVRDKESGSVLGIP